MTQLIAIDWGSSSLRIFLLNSDGQLLQRIRTDQGVLRCTDRSFSDILRQNLSRLPITEEVTYIAAGMITSQNGWIETPYLPCPADISTLASGLVCKKWSLGEIWFVPGLCQHSERADIMRGEEVQLTGLIAGMGEKGECTVVLPGTHCKWARITAGKIVSFTTFMTGEIFAAITRHTILAQENQVWLEDDFLEGVLDAADSGGTFLLSRLFQLRAERILHKTALASHSYISGFLIGMEIEEAITRGYINSLSDSLLITGEKTLAQRYHSAFTIRKITATVVDKESAAEGLYAIARKKGLFKAKR